MANKQADLTSKNSVSNHHPDYDKIFNAWTRIRDCIEGEDAVKAKRELYLPRPEGMSGQYANAYDAYLERAHFPLITSYALSGALGIIIAKLPEFNVPKGLSYIVENATKDGRSLQQLFLDTIIEVFQTARVPLVVDVLPNKNEFRFVQYKAEDFINWKISTGETESHLSLAVITEEVPDSDDPFSHSVSEQYRVLRLNEEGIYITQTYVTDSSTNKIVENEDDKKIPQFMGNVFNEIPLYIAGSINNSYDIQPIPLISVANCSIQIYRKEADLANSEFLSCNPTLVIVGASNDDDLPNVVGSSVMIVIPNEAARVFYTETDTAALTHVKDHIKDLYEEAIQHGVAILSMRKGVESAEALRIRQATQSASIYSIYLSALNAIRQGLLAMCRWGGFDESEVVIDAPSSLTYGIPDPAVIKQITEGFSMGVVPLNVVHKYLVASGLLDQTIGFEEYLDLLAQGDFGLDLSKNKSKNGRKGSNLGKNNDVSDLNSKEIEGVEDNM